MNPDRGYVQRQFRLQREADPMPIAVMKPASQSISDPPVSAVVRGPGLYVRRTSRVRGGLPAHGFVEFL